MVNYIYFKIDIKLYKFINKFIKYQKIIICNYL